MTEYITPQLMLAITTFEYNDDTKNWVATLTHTFHANTQQELYQLLEAHIKTDQFFAASFEGNFKGIPLVNSDPRVLYP